MPEVPPPPAPEGGRDAVVDWVGRHLDGLWSGPLAGSERFTGGQTAADAAIAGFDVAGYAARRNEVWPTARRGASALSPFIRHGLLALPRVWSAAAGGPGRDVARFRDELLWQEYARHLYARLGARTAAPLRVTPWRSNDATDAWDRRMACMDLTVGELQRDGWLVNQTRMWMASQWTVRHGNDWRAGEDRFFAHLLDGSRAANRLGWQWTIGAGTGRPYGFSRHQVERRAPGVCAACVLRDACPVASWPDTPTGDRVRADPLLRADPDPAATAGPDEVVTDGPAASAVWLTAESLGDDDPALLASSPELPAVFVFDGPLLHRLGLSAKRLVFLAEALGDLAARRPVEVRVGDPVTELDGRALATTFTPVPGGRARRAKLRVVATHPWPWLRRPGGEPLTSFSAWRSHLAGQR